MLILFFISVFLNGILLSKVFFKKISTPFFWASSFILGSLVSVEAVFLLYSLLGKFNNRLVLSALILMLASFSMAVLKRKDFKEVPYKLEKYEILFLTGILLFSGYIFFRSFSYDGGQGTFLLSSNTYLDFGAHLPIIRYFSLGQNAPGYLPFLGKQVLFYHFLFDFYAGILESLGLRIDWSYNLISTLSLTSLLISIYQLASQLFKSKAAGFLANVFVFFNGTLAFVLFLQNNAFNWQIINKIRNYNMYLDNGPFGQSPVSIFWNLNTFINQRHLVFAMAFFFWLVLWFVSNNSQADGKGALIIGILIGFLPFWHSEIFVTALVLVMGSYFFHRKAKLILTVLVAAFSISLPPILLIKLTSQNTLQWHLGFLIDKLTVKSFLSYWIWNLGFYIPVIIAAFFLLSGKAKKLFLVSWFFFLIPNFVQFGREIFNNHKFFNVWIIFMAVFAPFMIINLYRKNWLGKILSAVLVMLLTASGFLSFLVIKNDVWAKIPDYPGNNFMQWLIKNTNCGDLFLTNGDIYDPVTLTGRQTFLGKIYYVWAYGGDPNKREIEENSILDCHEDVKCLELLKSNRISYVVIYAPSAKRETKNITVNKEFFLKHFPKVYESDKEIVFKI